MADQHSYEFTDQARGHLSVYFHDRSALGYLGNAREARTLFETATELQAGRLAAVAEPTRDQLRVLYAEDLPNTAVPPPS